MPLIWLAILIVQLVQILSGHFRNSLGKWPLAAVNLWSVAVGTRGRGSKLVFVFFCSVCHLLLDFILCPQMNKFFKPALSLLLDLRLAACRIEKRLNPLVTFLDRHRTALRKYVYPECFDTIMKYLWECIVQVSVCVCVTGIFAKMQMYVCVNYIRACRMYMCVHIYT